MLHQWDFHGTCARCGATMLAIKRGDRADECNPGVVGITHILHALYWERTGLAQLVRDMTP